MKYFLKLADLLSHLVLILFMVSVILVATASSLLRYYLPDIADQKKEILAYINEKSPDVYINAEQIESQWKPFRPEITLYGVSFKPKGFEKTLKLEKLHLELDLIKSVIFRGPYFNYLEVANLDLVFLQNKEGQWSLSGSSSA